MCGRINSLLRRKNIFKNRIFLLRNYFWLLKLASMNPPILNLELTFLAGARFDFLLLPEKYSLRFLCSYCPGGRPKRWVRHLHLLFLFFAWLYAGASQADTIQPRVAAGVNHSLAVKSDGTIWGWDGLGLGVQFNWAAWGWDDDPAACCGAGDRAHGSGGGCGRPKPFRSS